MKAVLMSIKNGHILNIHSGNKTNELRTRPPKIECPFKVYNFDTESSGGSGKVVSEWICDNMTTWRICMGVPQHLVKTGCVSEYEILKYTDNGYKDLTAMHISNLIIYDKPKELSEFYYPQDRFCEMGLCGDCPKYEIPSYEYGEVMYDCEWKKPLTRPPQSWCYVEDFR